MQADAALQRGGLTQALDVLLTMLRVACCVLRYTGRMIKSFKHKGLEQFFESGTTRGIQSNHAQKLRMQLAHYLRV